MTSALVIAPTLGLDKLAWAGLAFIGLVGTYGSLIRTFEMENEQISGVLRLDMLSVIRAITCRTTGSLVILVGVLMLLASPQTSILMSKSIVIGTVKTVHWTSVLSLVSILQLYPINVFAEPYRLRMCHGRLRQPFGPTRQLRRLLCLQLLVRFLA